MQKARLRFFKNSRYLFLLPVIFFGLVVVFGSGGGGDDGSDSSTDTPDNPSTGVQVGPSGGAVKPTDGADNSLGTQLIVPPNAVYEEVSIQMKVSISSVDELADVADSSPVAAIIDFAMDRSDEDYLHPMITPCAILAGGIHVGLNFELSPDGMQFLLPVTLEIPIDDISLESDDLAVVILENEEGSAEVLQDVRISADTIKISLLHFSNVSIWRIIKNMSTFTVMSAFMFPKDDIDYAKQIVGPFVDNVCQDILAAQCIQNGLDPFVNTGMLPSQLALTNNLARSVGEIGGDTLALHNPLKNFINNVRLQGLPPVSMAEIYIKSLELTGGDVFKALVLAHEVLRSDRFKKEFKDLIEDVRGDGSDNEVGARYHLLGTAIYGFWYEYIQQQKDSSKLFIDSDMASLLEEAFVSGDILSDPGEYVVDMDGAELGRNLYLATIAAQEGKTGLCDELFPDLPWYYQGTWTNTDSWGSDRGPFKFCVFLDGAVSLEYKKEGYTFWNLVNGTYETDHSFKTVFNSSLTVEGTFDTNSMSCSGTASTGAIWTANGTWVDEFSN